MVVIVFFVKELLDRLSDIEGDSYMAWEDGLRCDEIFWKHLPL